MWKEVRYDVLHSLLHGFCSSRSNKQRSVSIPRTCTNRSWPWLLSPKCLLRPENLHRSPPSAKELVRERQAQPSSSSSDLTWNTSRCRKEPLCVPPRRRNTTVKDRQRRPRTRRRSLRTVKKESIHLTTNKQMSVNFGKQTLLPSAGKRYC